MIHPRFRSGGGHFVAERSGFSWPDSKGAAKLRGVDQKLASVGWDFADSSRRPGGLHPYPARFIPEIPAALIGLFGREDRKGVVFDPFCGSGTTLSEASRLGRPSVGVDLNPLACLVAKVRTTQVSTGVVELAGQRVLAEARKVAESSAAVVPDIPRLDHWFKREIQQALAALVREVDRIPETDIANVLRVALSAIIVRVSNQESDTRYAAVEKKVAQQDVWRLFARSLSGVTASIAEQAAPLFGQGRARVLNRNILDVEPTELGDRVGLVITSPPYPNAYEYWLYHKYRMYWLGMDPIAVRTSEIGARPHYFKKNHQTELDFEAQMGRVFALLSRVCLSGSYACFVVGRSIIHGRVIDNGALLRRAAEPHGFAQVGFVERSILKTRKSFNLAHGTINREGILVLAFQP